MDLSGAGSTYTSSGSLSSRGSSLQLNDENEAMDFTCATPPAAGASAAAAPSLSSPSSAATLGGLDAALETAAAAAGESSAAVPPHLPVPLDLDLGLGLGLGLDLGLEPRRRIVVCGGTGRQGGWVARHLLRSAGRFEVVVLTRTPAGADAQAMAALGAGLVKGDINDVASLVAAFEGAYGVYGVTNPFLARFSLGMAPKADTGAEARQGRNIIDACRVRGVRHLVMSSVASAGDKTGVPAFESKWSWECHLAREAAVGRAVPATVFAPVGFFENLESNFAKLRQGVVPSLLSKGRRVQFVSAEDVGFFVCLAFEQPERWVGRRFELAADERSAEDLCEAIARLRGEPGRWHVSAPPELLLRLVVPAAVASLRRFLEERGCHVDVSAVRREHPGLMSFEQWFVHRGLDRRVLPSPGWAACAIA